MEPSTAALHDGLCILLRTVITEIFHENFEVESKGQSGLDFVTSVDLAMQARLKSALADLLPGSLVVGEEGFGGMGSGSAPVWLVDPLDGTVNLVAGLPSYAVAVVLIIDNVPVLSAVHDIPRAITYSARAGIGAFCDGEPLRRRDHTARLAILSSGLLQDLATHSPATLGRFLGACKLRNFGSQALHLCYAAAGHVSLVASREARGWDDMAGALIAREAGLVYGHYGAAEPPATDADQYSLCAPAEIFETYAREFSRSVAPAGGL